MARTNAVNMLVVILLAQLFFSFAITNLAYAIPSDARKYVTSYSSITQEINITTTADEISDNMESQTNIPVIDVGSLIFYSGNILIDLFLNFAFAIPEMIGLLLYGISLIINIPTFYIATIEGFTAGVILILYVLGAMQLLTSLRTGRAV